jgi:hypothetical protein
MLAVVEAVLTHRGDDKRLDVPSQREVDFADSTLFSGLTTAKQARSRYHPIGWFAKCSREVSYREQLTF